MTNSFQGGTFDPVESEDYVAPLSQSYKEINADMDNYWTQELSNEKYKAQDAGKGLEALSQMSGTVSEYLAKREERKKKEDIIKGHMWLKDNPLSILQQEEFDAEVERLKAEGKELDEFLARYEKKEGSDIWTSQSFRDLNAAEKYGAVVNHVEGIVERYDPSNDPQMQNAVSYEDFETAKGLASRRLYEQIGDINSALVYKHVIGAQKEKEQAAYQKWYAKREKETKEERVKIATNALESCMLNGQMGCHTDFLNKRSPYVGQGNANKEYFTALNNLAQRGKLTSNMITDIELRHRKNRITSTADGKEYWFNDFHSAEWDQVKASAREVESRMMTEKKKAKDAAAVAELDQTLKDLQGDNFDATEGYSSEAISELQRLQTKFVTTGVTGTPLTRVNNILNYGGETQVTARLQKTAALKEAETGVLTTERLNEKYPLLRDDATLKAKAKANDPVYGKRQVHNKAIQADIKSTIQIEGGTADELLVIDHFQTKYALLVNTLDEQGVQDPQGEALKQIQAEIQQAKDLDEDRVKNNETWYKRGEWRMLGMDTTPDAATKFNNELTLKLNNVNKAIQDNGISVLDTQQLFHPEDLQEWDKGERIPLFATKLADKLNSLGHRTEDGQLFTGYDVMQRQKKIANIETLDEPSSVKAYKELSVDAQKLCRQNSSNCTTRALATSGKENTDFIPFEQGEDMKVFAQENGTTFSEFAASLEILPKLNLDFGVENPFASMDEYDWLEYNKAVWKYSGGTNKEALEATKRDAFKS